MNVLLLPLSKIGVEYIYFLDTKKNMLMDGFFSKILYFHPHFSFNGIYLHLPIEIQNIEAYNFHKTTIYFSVSQHSLLLHQIDLLEKNILSQYTPMDLNVNPVYSIIQNIKTGYFRIYRENPSSNPNLDPNSNSIPEKKNGFVLKISGVWENSKGYGLSYKIMG
jgi:hypothetical protein